jgi:hypothetical protein
MLFYLQYRCLFIFVIGSEDIVEEHEEILKVVEMVDVWLRAVIARINAKEVTALGDFLRPRDSDLSLMQSDLTSSAGLNGCWADVLRAFP